MPRLDARKDGYRVAWREPVLMAEGVESERIRSRKRYEISLKNSVNNVLIALCSSTAELASEGDNLPCVVEKMQDELRQLRRMLLDRKSKTSNRLTLERQERSLRWNR